MAAYAALLSLKYIIEQLQHHPHPPISIDQNQLVHSLTKNVNFLQNFLENYSHILKEEADALQSLIVEAAYAAEDVIETHIVDQIFAQSTTHGERTTSLSFNEDLERVLKNMDFIEKEVMEIKQQKHKRPKHAISPWRLASRERERRNILVGLDDVKTQVMEKLAGGQIDRQLITIVGMGGIGKTTLAKIVYEDPFILEYFHIHAWASLSQEYSVKGILLELLLYLGSQESSSEESEERLGERLYKSLCGKRYLIVMDDTWSIEAWDSVKLFFPDNKNGSRIMITTRRSDVALHLSSHEDRVIKMEFLDENKSWNLFCQIVFGYDISPFHQLWEIGKTIARTCQGLPLAIVVIGRLLARSERTMGYWEWILENLNSIANIEDNERYFKILHLSYAELPIHLKPCFLYMGAFGENREIRVSCLIKLWVAEGFLKPITGKSLEDVAKKYLKELIDRNLVLVHKRGSNGKIKICNMHDVLREVCLVEAEKHKFLYVRERHSFGSPQGIDTQRRIAIHSTEFLDALQSESVARSFICDILGVLPSLNCKLLRILKAVDKYSVCLLGEYSVEAIIFQLVNACYLAICADWNPINSRIPSSMCLLWKLQTLIIKGAPENTIAPSEIWKMSQLRHVEVDELYLPDPPSGNKDNQNDDSVLGNLQTLSRIRNFKCSEEVVMRIPNIKKLKIFYSERFSGSHYCLNNLAHLDNLVSLHCDFYPSARPSRSDLMQNLSFSHSLMKLTLKGCNLHWKDISTKIGVLPFLQVLKLRENSFIGPVWEPLEAQFCKLNWLEISKCDDLELWEADDNHFPRLEHLVLQNLTRLKEIPSGFSDITTLESIQLINCSLSIITSAGRIREVQLSLGNEGPKVQIRGELPSMPEQFLKGNQKDVQPSVVEEEAGQPLIVRDLRTFAWQFFVVAIFVCWLFVAARPSIFEYLNTFLFFLIN